MPGLLERVSHRLIEDCASLKFLGNFLIAEFIAYTIRQIKILKIACITNCAVISSFLLHKLSNSSICKDLIASAAVSYLAVAMIKKFVIMQLLIQRIKIY